MGKSQRGAGTRSDTSDFLLTLLSQNALCGIGILAVSEPSKLEKGVRFSYSAPKQINRPTMRLSEIVDSGMYYHQIQIYYNKLVQLEQCFPGKVYVFPPDRGGRPKTGDWVDIYFTYQPDANHTTMISLYVLDSEEELVQKCNKLVAKIGALRAAAMWNNCAKHDDDLASSK